ncbi:MAG: type II secretion system protein [Candidatus Eremiobacteraeota bacterium]|nr:type II secretion system protein [Candidatus Eremiobacteraeota bacterium]
MSIVSRKKYGFSLIELMVAVSLFLGLSVLVFGFFRYGTRAFFTANQKHGMQMDALRTIESLQMELKRSARASVYPESGPSRSMIVEGQTVQRDVISFATLKDFRDISSSENYDPTTGAPLWNRYWVYYATKEEEGRMVRLKVDPDPAPEAPVPLPQSDFERLYYDNPSSNTFEGQNPPYVVLAKNVYDFRVTGVEGAFFISLKLKEKHQKETVEAGERRPYDYYEIDLSIRPENSFPNDL